MIEPVNSFFHDEYCNKQLIDDKNISTLFTAK
jgi:hypothetical protein